MNKIKRFDFSKAKYSAIKIIVLLNIIIVLSAFQKHPIKLTAMLIEYDPKTNGLYLECKVFIDDFEKSINKTLTKNINTSNPSASDKEGINDYFNNYVKLCVNKKKLELKYKSSEVVNTYNVFLIKFENIKVNLKKGDKFEISNTLFFEEYNYLQSNRMTVRLPPFITEDHLESRIDDYYIPYSL